MGVETIYFAVARKEIKMAKKKASKMASDKGQIVGIATLGVAVTTMAVGFAAYSATLNISGTATVKAAKWDIEWCNTASDPMTGCTAPAETKTAAVTATTGFPSVTSNNTTVNFDITIDPAEVAGTTESYVLTSYAANAGTIDAILSKITISKFDATYISAYSISFGDTTCASEAGTGTKECTAAGTNGDKLAAEATKAATITVTYKQLNADSLPDEDVELTFTGALLFNQDTD